MATGGGRMGDGNEGEARRGLEAPFPANPSPVERLPGVRGSWTAETAQNASTGL